MSHPSTPDLEAKLAWLADTPGEMGMVTGIVEQLRMGKAILEIMSKPHRGCLKFSNRFGSNALRFVNSEAGSEMQLRGVYARVVSSGLIELGNSLEKIGNPVSTAGSDKW